MVGSGITIGTQKMQRKPTKQSRRPNKKEKDFQAWLKHRPCCVSGAIGVHVHHCAGSAYKHNKIHIGHMYCIPLSPEMHALYHAGTKSFQETYGHQARLWEREINDYLDFCDPTGLKDTEIFIDYGVFDAILDLAWD